MPNRLGDEPIQAEYRAMMNDLAAAIDQFFNGDVPAAGRKTGYVLMVFPFGAGGRCNYISNANRADVIVMLKEQLKRFEGQAEMSGRA